MVSPSEKKAATNQALGRLWFSGESSMSSEKTDDRKNPRNHYLTGQIDALSGGEILWNSR